VDSSSDWRVIDADDDQDEARSKRAPDVGHEEVSRWLVGAIVAVVGAASAFAIWATLPTGGVAVQPSGGLLDPRNVAGDLATPAGSFATSVIEGSSVVVVDVEGAVMKPGVHELAAGSRVGDAVVAAGGYATNADINAAATSLNLASKLTDGQQIRVPALGDVTSTPAVSDTPGGGGDPASSGGLIDINNASAEELDTLPGIGPVTTAKIIDARTQAPFATVDELQSRGVVGQSTFDKLRDLITVAP